MPIYKFTDLVLLVGTNTLPNYVVAKYFIKNNDSLKNIWLVHSEKIDRQNGTYELAQNIKEVLDDEFGKVKIFGFIALEDVSLSKKIVENIKNKLVLKLPRNSSGVHLNYTGGTKAMAVHVYRALEKEKDIKSCTFSYLDARDFSIKDDDDGVVPGDLRESIRITLDSLIKLHGYIKKEPQDNPDWPDAVNTFKYLIDEDKLSIYLNWAKGCLQKTYYNSKGFIKNKTAFWTHNNLINKGQIDPVKVAEFKTIFENNTPPEVMEVLSKIPQEHSLLDEQGKLWIPDKLVTKAMFEERLGTTIKNFLHGKWLEVYAYNVLRDKIKTDPTLCHQNIPMESNWRITKPGMDNFELDVIVLNGYQVCGISCTTSTKEGLCKEKGFEVLHRVNQIGGDEAKAVLITCLDDGKVEELNVDLSTFTGSIDKKLLIIGMSKLKDEVMWKEIKQHIWG